MHKHMHAFTDGLHSQVYPLDLGFTNESEVPPKVLQSKYYAGLSGFDIRSVAAKVMSPLSI